MIFVVQYLEFCADSRSLSLIEDRIHKIFNTAVGSLRDPELKFQLKITVLIRRHNVAGTRRFPAVRLLHRQQAIADFPSAFREMVQLCSPSPLGGLTVPKQPPAVTFLPVRELIFKITDGPYLRIGCLAVLFQLNS